MKNDLTKTSHYLDSESIEKINSLSECNARSKGWIVRKCVEFGLQNAELINFHEPVKLKTRAVEIVPNADQSIDQFAYRPSGTESRE